jgi:hypothetical protein
VQINMTIGYDVMNPARAVDREDRLMTSLIRVRCGMAALLACRQEHAQMDNLAYQTLELVRHYLGQLRYEHFHREVASNIPTLALSDEQDKLRKAIQDDFRRYRMELEWPAMRAKVTDGRQLMLYRSFMDGLLADSRCIWAESGAQWTTEWKMLLQDLVELTVKCAPESAGPMMPGMVRRPPATQPGTRPAAATAPTTRMVRGTTRPMMLPVGMGSGRAGSAYLLLPHTVTELVNQDWGSTVGGAYHPLMWQMTEEDAMRMVSLGDIFAKLPGVTAAEFGKVWQFDWQQKWRLEMQKRKAVEEKNAPAAAAPAEAMPRVPEVPIRKLQGAARQSKETGPGSIWEDSRTLIDTMRDHDTPQQIGFPCVDEDRKYIYVLGATYGTPNATVELLRCNLRTGERQQVTQLDVPGKYWASTPSDRERRQQGTDMYSARAGGATARLYSGYYVFCDRSRGVLLFSLDGRVARVIDQESEQLPGGFYQSACILGDSLYIALGNPQTAGYIVALDLKNKGIKTLASSKRLPDAAGGDASPFDNMPPLYGWAMVPDVARGRVLMLIGGTGWKPKLSGWWTYTPGTGKFDQLCPVAVPGRSDSASVSLWTTRSGDAVLFPGTGAVNSMDLATGKITTTAIPSAGARQKGPALKGPFTPCDGWLWGAFGRMRAGEKGKAELQVFRPVRQEKLAWTFWPAAIIPVGGGEMVVCDEQALWLLKLPEADAGRMQKVLMDPVPEFHWSEPVQDLPVGGQLPWQEAKALYDVAQGNSARVQVLGLQVRREDVYGAALENAGGNAVVKVVRIPLDGGPEQVLGTARGTGTLERQLSAREQAAINYSDYGPAAMDDRYYYFAMPHAGAIYAFPLAGGESKRLVMPKPGKYPATIRQMAAVGGKLFARLVSSSESGDWAALVRCDATTGQCDELMISSSAPATMPATMPADSRIMNPQTGIVALTADAARQRVLFFVHERSADAARDGLWEVGMAGEPRRLAHLSLRSRRGLAWMENCSTCWAGEIHVDRWLVHTPALTVDIDVANMDYRLLQFTGKAGRFDLGRESQPGADTALNTALRAPLEISGRWLWTGSFSRVKLDGTVHEEFAPLRPNFDTGYRFEPQLLHAMDDGKRMLVADRCALWILTMKNGLK